MECPICLEDSNDIVKIDCGHCFCRECCIKYIEYNRNRNRSLECPMCRCIINEPSNNVENRNTILLILAFVLFVVFLRYVAEI